jgi:hypothetical protein
MCYGCWEDAGKPDERTPSTALAVAAIRRLYDLNCVGGPLHIVTDDWNLDDDSVEWCRDHLADDAPHEEMEASRAVLDLIEPMTEAQRFTALAVWEGFLPESVQ